MVGVCLIAAIMIFLWMKNIQDNRAVDRHNRMVEKQEELLEMLQKNNDKKQEDDN